MTGSNNPVAEKILQEKIIYLTGLLEHELDNLKQAHNKEFLKIELSHSSEWAIQNEPKELNKLLHVHEQKIMELKDEILYLRELNQSQRLMMENNLEYTRALEQQIKGRS